MSCDLLWNIFQKSSRNDFVATSEAWKYDGEEEKCWMFPFSLDKGRKFYFLVLLMMILHVSSVQHMDDFLPFVYFLSMAVKKKRSLLMDQQIPTFRPFLLEEYATKRKWGSFWAKKFQEIIQFKRYGKRQQKETLNSMQNLQNFVKILRFAKTL